MKHAATFLLTTLLLSACAGEPEMRLVAGQSAQILTTYRGSVRDFAAGQTALNNANERRLDQLRGQKVQRDAEIAIRRDGWELAGKKEALRRFTIYSRVRADDLLARMTARPAAAPSPALTYDGSDAETVLKQLVALGKPVTTEQRLNDLVAFGTKLRERYRDNLEEANATAADATGQGSETASAILVQDQDAGPDAVADQPPTDERNP